MEVVPLHPERGALIWLMFVSGFQVSEIAEREGLAVHLVIKMINNYAARDPLSKVYGVIETVALVDKE